MSGLDGLGWPNPEDEPKPKTMNDTPTPETNALIATDQHHLEDDQFMPVSTYWRMCDLARKLERERDEWKAKYIQQNKDLGCELRDPNGTIWDHAKTLQRERDEAREVLREIRDNEVNPEDEADKFLRDHLPSELSKVREQRDAVTLRLGETQERMIDAERQRDRLAEALVGIKNELGVPQPEYPAPVANAVKIADEALNQLNL
jgi:hypothetical protein